MDEVDRLVEAWRCERPDLDVEPLQIISRISRIAEHVDAARREAFAILDLEPWEFDVLAALRKSGHPHTLSPGQLLAETHVTSGTMTNRLTRLERRGLAVRRPSAHDGRSVDVQLTEAGKAKVDDALAELIHRESALLSGLSPEERKDLAPRLRALLSQFS